MPRLHVSRISTRWRNLLKSKPGHVAVRYSRVTATRILSPMRARADGYVRPADLPAMPPTGVMADPGQDIGAAGKTVKQAMNGDAAHVRCYPSGDLPTCL